MAAPPQTPCPVHPRHVLEVACERCGVFVCPSCLSEAYRCQACEERAMAGLPSLAVLRPVTVVIFAVTAVGRLALQGVSALESESLWAGLLSGLLGLWVLVGLLASMGVYLRWLWVAVRRARSFGALSDVSPAYALWSHVLPILGLVLPFTVMRRLLYQAREARSLPWVTAWQVCWLGASVGVTASMFAGSKMVDSLQEVTNLLTTLCQVSIAVLVWKVGTLERQPTPVVVPPPPVATGDFALR